MKKIQVVNCFQNLYFRRYNATIVVELMGGIELWIAFKICIFVDTTQPDEKLVEAVQGCELLSKFVFS